MYALAFLIGLFWLLAPIIAIVVALRTKSQLGNLRDELHRLELGLNVAKQKLAALAERGEAIPPAVTVPLPPRPEPPPPPRPEYSPPQAPLVPSAPIPVPVPIPIDEVTRIAATAPIAPPAPITAPVPIVASAAIEEASPAAPATPRKRVDSDRLEQLIGGIWLQNVGSVLLLLGTFFLILWGYTQGKIGPEVLVAAGVVFGGVLAWRGDRIARTLRPLGQALLGVGLGVVYITIYLGHFRMNVLPEWTAFALLALLSFITVDIGLRRRQAVIAALGVAGAFVPLLMSSLPGAGFDLPLSGLLGYFVVVNAVVLVLTAIRGWSGLVLMALVFTTITWGIQTNGAGWGFPIQLGLSALYLALGMAPVVRLVRSPTPVRGLDLAVVALAPMFLLIGSIPYFAATKGIATGGLLAALGLVNLIVAAWVDSRRSERDLWRPLTAAGTIFIAAALERLLANEYVALAWCVEGAVLVWLGLAPRGGWIRGMGYAVSVLAVMRLLLDPGSYDPAAGGGIGIFSGTALRDLLCIAAFLIVSDRIGRRRESLSERERNVPSVWIAGVNALVMIWFGREATNIARWLAGPGAPVSIATSHAAPVEAPPPRVDVPLVLAPIWTVHAAVLLLLAAVRRAPFLRAVSYFIGGAALTLFLVVVAGHSYWRDGDVPILYPAGLLTLTCVVGIAGMAAFLWSRRGTLLERERQAPELAVVAANFALLLWVGNEAGHVASALTPGVPLATAIMALAFTAQAAVMVLLADARRAPFLRHVGYFIGFISAFPFLMAVAEERLWKAGDPPILYPGGLLTLACVIALIALAAFLSSRRPSLAGRERMAPEIAAIVANAFLFLWTAREAAHVAFTMAPNGALALPATAVAWTAHAVGLTLLATARQARTLRHIGYAIGATSLVPYLVALTDARHWKQGDMPVLYPAGLMTLFCVTGLTSIASTLWSRRGTLASAERRAPEAALVAASVALLLWTAREAGHVATAIAPGASLTPGAGDSVAMLAAGITCAAWILQAGALLAIGWVRGSAFHRWTGLALVGLTLTKFVVFDLQRVDVFWRFIIALGVGAVLLLFSFVYQRRSRSAKTVAG